METPEEAEQKALAEQEAIRQARRSGTATVSTPQHAVSFARETPPLPATVDEAKQVLSNLVDPHLSAAVQVLVDEIRRLKVDGGLPVQPESALSSPYEDGIILGKKDTSRKAAAVHFPKSGTQRGRVFEVIAKHGPMTDDEILAHPEANVTANSVRARRLELVKGGWVKESAEKSASARNNEASQYELADKGRQLIETRKRDESAVDASRPFAQ